MTTQPPAPEPSAAPPNRMCFVVGLRDLRAAYWRHAWFRILRWQPVAGVVVVSSIVSLAFVLLERRVSGRIAGLVLLGTFTGGSVGFLIGTLGQVPLLARKVHKQQANLRHETWFEWNAEAFHSWSAAGSSTTPWGDFVRWRESRSVVLLYHSDVSFRIVPKRVMTGEQLNDLRAAAARCRVPGAIPDTGPPG